MPKRMPLGTAKQVHPKTLRLHTLCEPLQVPGPKGKLLALDQSTSCTGFALYDNGEIIYHGHFKPSGKKIVELMESLEIQLNKWLDEYQPDIVVCETGGQFGAARNPGSGIGMVVSEYTVARVCYQRKQPLFVIHNSTLKDVIVDKERILGFKRAGIRNTVRPIKEDVQHAVCEFFAKDISYFTSPDHIDAIAIVLAYSTNPEVAKIQ